MKKEDPANAPSRGTIALFLVHLISLTALPQLVISISYGIAESLITAAGMDLFDINAIILGAMGKTIVTAAGDDGVFLWTAQMDAADCGSNPRYPASSPSYYPLVALRLVLEPKTRMTQLTSVSIKT